MILLDDEIESSYKTLEMYYLQRNRNRQPVLATYINSNEREQLKILENYLCGIDVSEDFQEEYIFIWLSSYDEAKLYLNIDEINEELKESYSIYKDLYKVIDVVILRKWDELKKDLCA